MLQISMKLLRRLACAVSRKMDAVVQAYGEICKAFAVRSLTYVVLRSATEVPLSGNFCDT